MDEILTIREIAAYLKISRTTVWRWCAGGQLPAFRVGRGWRVRRTEVEKMLGQSLGEGGAFEKLRQSNDEICLY